MKTKLTSSQGTKIAPTFSKSKPMKGPGAKLTSSSNVKGLAKK